MMVSTTMQPMYLSAELCMTYRNKTPTARYLMQNAPPEYFPLLGIAAFFMIISTLLLIVESKRHAKYFKGVYFKLSGRYVMILAAFWLFALTSFLGIVLVRGDIFLHFVANVYECACLLAFFDCIILHCRAIGEVFDGSQTIAIRVPPCCCCLFCLPEMKTTKKNLFWIRFTIIQLMFFQTLVEFMRTLGVLDCNFDPEATHVMVFDILVMISFFFAMWGVFVIVKGNGTKLVKYRYIQKFATFKLMIIVQKFLYKLLSFIAKRNGIPAYRGLNGKLRCTIWTNFVCVVVSTLLFIVSRRFYVEADYEVLQDSETQAQYLVEENRDVTVKNEPSVIAV